MDVSLPEGLIYGGGLLLLAVLLRFLGRPLLFILSLVVRSVAGGLILWLFNLLGTPWGLEVGINPASAFVVGVLGLPGLASLGLVRWVLG